MAKKYKPKPWKDMTPQERIEYREGERVERIVNFFLLALAALFFFWYLENEKSYTQFSQSIESGRTRARASLLPPLSALLAVVSIFRLARSYLRGLAHMLDDLPEDRPAAQFWLWLKRNRGKLCLGLLALLLAGWLLKDLFARMAAESGLTFFSALCQACWGFLQGAWGLIWGILQFLFGLFLLLCFALVLKLCITGIAALVKHIGRVLKKIPAAIMGMFKK